MAPRRPNRMRQVEDQLEGEEAEAAEAVAPEVFSDPMQAEEVKATDPSSGSKAMIPP